jgi:hypothetical protein
MGRFKEILINNMWWQPYECKECCLPVELNDVDGFICPRCIFIRNLWRNIIFHKDICHLQSQKISKVIG